MGFHRAILVTGADSTEFEFEAPRVVSRVFLGGWFIGGAVDLGSGIPLGHGF